MYKSIETSFDSLHSSKDMRIFLQVSLIFLPVEGFTEASADWLKVSLKEFAYSIN